ncbi:MAG: peptide chain release factor 1 [Rhodothermales bacterium]
MIPEQTLRDIKLRHAEIEQLMAQPEVATDSSQMESLGREHAELTSIVALIDRFASLQQERDDLEGMVKSETGEMAELAELELEGVEERLPKVEEELRLALIPKDPEDSKDAILEIRAGTGGDEASLFTGDLFRLYTRFAERRGWRVEVMDATEGAQGGYKDVTLSLKGPDVFGTMKWESGVHRVQRVPATESQGRIHTSAATVAVLPEAEEVDVTVHANDLEIDVYRSSGPGGQSVNTTDSAVRITHKPTGLVVTCQDEKSQHKNKDKAMRVLRSRLYQLELDKINSARSEQRRALVGTGDRSEKIRTYNYPQSRVTDHRLTGDDKNHQLAGVLDGDLDPIISALRMADNAERLSGLEG